MKKSGFTEEQIIGILHEQEVGAATRWAMSGGKCPVRGCRGDVGRCAVSIPRIAVTIASATPSFATPEVLASTGAIPAFSFGTTLTFKPSGQRLRNRRLS
jgi:hypothetical protein